MDVEWRTIEEFPNYEINEYAVVRNKITNKELKPNSYRRGDLQLQLYKGGKRWLRLIARLVAKAFIPNPDNKPQVNHINADIKNNHISNLEWVTGDENLEHARINKLLSKASRVVVQYDKKGNYINEFESATAATKYLNLKSPSSVTNVCRKVGHCKTAGGYIWRYKDAD